MPPPNLLAQAPHTVDDGTGTPRFGAYEGTLPKVVLDSLKSPYLPSLPGRLWRRKRWQYQVLCTHEVICVLSVADLGHSVSAFATVVDLGERRPVYDGSFLSIPGPMAHVKGGPLKDLSARLWQPGAKFHVQGPDRHERYQLSAQVDPVLGLRDPLSLAAEVLAAGGAPALTVIAPVSDGRGVNVTQKWAGRLGFGTVTAGGRAYNLDGAVAGLDYTHGFLPRRTSWRWAMALGRLRDGSPVGVNLVEGFNDTREDVSENALWVADALQPVGRARFEFNPKDLLDPWRVRTEDGAVDLSFRPLFVHREERDYKLVRSRFAQPVGTFSGTLRVNGVLLEVSGLGGVTESQDVLW